MSAVEHDHARLGAYILGALEPAEAAEFESHLASCAECRREVAELSGLRGELDEVPPEAFLDGPPTDGDLVLARTLRQVRAAESPKRRWPAFAAAAAIAVVSLGGGVLIGRQSVPGVVAVSPSPTNSAPAPGIRRLDATDAGTGVSLAVEVTPAVGWVRLHASVGGVSQGEKCQLVVVSKQGKSWIAGSWTVWSNPAHEKVGVDGSALVAADDIASVELLTIDGRKLVTARA